MTTIFAAGSRFKTWAAVVLCLLSLWQSLLPLVLWTQQQLAFQGLLIVYQPLASQLSHHDCCRQLLENLGFHDALPPEPVAEPSTLSSVDAAAASLEDAHLHNAGLGGDGFGADGLSPHDVDNGDFFEQRGRYSKA